MQTFSASSFPQFHPSGERCLLAVYGQGVDVTVNEKLRRITALLNQELRPGIEEVVPSYSSLAVFYDPAQISLQALCDLLRECEQNLDEAQIDASRTITIPVCYGGEFGPDLEYVAEYHHMTQEEVIKKHTSGDYLVYMIGFAPGFPYVGGLPEEIATPRRKTPRLVIPKGSVGIAGKQTGAYPLETPGGWQLIGRTPLELFRPHDMEHPSVLAAGDRLEFYAITPEEFKEIAAREGGGSK